MLKPVVVSLFLSAIGVAASAQGTREVPPDALKGRMTSLQFPQVSIDGRTYRLAPGARIYRPDRSMTTPNQVAAETPVRYVLDAQGNIKSVWIVDGRGGGTRRTGPQQ